MFPTPITDEQRAVIAAYRPVATFVPAHWEEGTVLANGIRQHYWRTGADSGKPPLLLLHGTMGNGLTWLRVAKVLEADYDVIMPDARGHGRTEFPGAHLRWADFAEDLAGFIEALGLERPLVLGHSMGGSTAARLAATRPELVRAVVLEDVPWRLAAGRALPSESPRFLAWLDTFTAWLEAYQTQPFAEQLLSALPYLPPGAAAWPEEDYVAWVAAYAEYALALQRLAAEQWATAADATAAGLVAQASCPVLLLQSGRPSPMSPYDANVTESWPHLRVVRFDADHFIHLGAFDAFLAEVTRFLAEQTERPASS